MLFDLYRRRGVVLLGLLLAIPMTTVGGQSDRLPVRINDDSDWWSLTRPTVEDEEIKLQKREIPEASFRILGVALEDDDFKQAFATLGAAAAVVRGDASVAREQVCYMSPGTKGRTYLIFEHGEVNYSLYLFSEDRAWNGRGFCVSSAKVSASVATMSGLHLGPTREQVIAILGPPSIRRQNEIRYLLEVQKKESPEALLRARNQHPELSQEQLHKDFDTYDLSVYISAHFSHSRLTYLAVSMAETT